MGGIKMKKLFFIAFASLVIQTNAFSQSVFKLDLTKDIIIGSLSTGVFVSPFFVNNEPDSIPVNLDKNAVNGFDRSFMFSYNRTLDKISDYGVYGMLILPVISVIPDIKNVNTLLTYGVMYGEAVLLTFGTKDLLKNAIIRYRPYMYNGGVPAGNEDDYFNSFPSGSTSLAFLSATFLTATFAREFPDSKWKWPVIIGSYTMAAGVASMRIFSGSHFLTDVLAGAAIGSLYGWLMPQLHLRKNNENLSIIPTGNGLLVSVKF